MIDNDIKNAYFSRHSSTNMLGNSLWTYAIIFWWCRMHAFNSVCKPLCVVFWTCSSSLLWWGVIHWSLTASMAAFSFSNWLQATAIRVVQRDRKPHTIPSASSDARLCNQWNYYCFYFFLIQAIEECNVKWFLHTN